MSVTADGTPGDYLSIEPSVAANGAAWYIYSPSTNLVPDGGNRVADAMAKVFTAPTPPDSVAPTAELVASPTWLPANRGSQPVAAHRDRRRRPRAWHRVVLGDRRIRRATPIIDPQDLAGQTSATWQRQVPLDTTVHPGDHARNYTITATVSDLAGNTTTSSTHVIICRGMSGYNQ